MHCWFESVSAALLAKFRSTVSVCTLRWRSGNFVVFKQILHGLLVSPVSQEVLTVIYYSSPKLPAQLSVGEDERHEKEHTVMCRRPGRVRR